MSLSNLIKRGVSTFQSLQQVKKFYKNVSVEKYTDSKHPEHLYAIKLDGRNIKTPNKNVLATPTEALGLAVAAEFLMQKEFMKPATMPLFALTRTAIDIDFDPNLRPHLESALLNFFETDTLWYRNTEEQRLYKLQVEQLDPVVAYINNLLSTKMKVITGFESNKLTQEERQRLTKYFSQCVQILQNNWKILSLEYSASTLKSTALAISLMNNKLGIEEALDLSRFEENYQQTLYGIVEGDHDVDEHTSFMMVAAAKNFFSLTH